MGAREFWVAALTLILLTFQNCGSRIDFEQGPNGANPSSESGSDVELPGGEDLDSPGQFKAECDQKKNKKPEALGAIDELEDLWGSKFFEAESIGEVEDVYGKTIIHGTQADSYIGILEDVRGKTVICNMDVDRIEDTKGKVIVVGGNVGDVKDLKGLLLVIDGDILGDKEDIKGVIKVVDSN